MSHWQILGRCIASPPPADWRERLLARLHSRPRRLGSWCELGLFGALECLADAGEDSLPDHARLSVATRYGPDQALLGALRSAAEDGLPMPMAFLQSQPGQLVAHFSAATGWLGDGRMLACRQPIDALRLSCGAAGASELLLGWLDEREAEACSLWLRLRRLPPSLLDTPPLPGSVEAFADPDFRFFRV